MTRVASILCKLFDQVPQDLLDYFKQAKGRTLRGENRSGVNLNSPDEAVTHTLNWRTLSSLVRVLGGVILDDEHTSHYRVYLSHPACSGCVFYMKFQGGSSVVFSSVQEFLAAAKRAIAEKKRLVDLHPPAGLPLPNQTALRQLFADVYDGRVECDESSSLLTGLMQSLHIEDDSLLRRMVQDRDIYLVESIGRAIVARPRDDLKELAKLLSKHPNEQAASAGKQALQAIEGVNSFRELKPPVKRRLTIKDAKREADTLMAALGLAGKFQLSNEFLSQTVSLLNGEAEAMIGGPETCRLVDSQTAELAFLYDQLFRTFGYPLNERQRLPDATLDQVANSLGVAVPVALREYYLRAGREKRFNTCHNRFLPVAEWSVNQGKLVFMEENQGVVKWGVSVRKASAVDPPVWQAVDDDDEGDWIRESRRCSEFISVMLHYQAVCGGLKHRFSIPCNPKITRKLNNRANWTCYGRVNRLTAYSRQNQVVCIEPEMGVMAAAKTAKDLSAIEAELTREL